MICHKTRPGPRLTSTHGLSLLSGILGSITQIHRGPRGTNPVRDGISCRWPSTQRQTRPENRPNLGELQKGIIHHPAAPTRRNKHLQPQVLNLAFFSPAKAVTQTFFWRQLNMIKYNFPDWRTETVAGAVRAAVPPVTARGRAPPGSCIAVLRCGSSGGSEHPESGGNTHFWQWKQVPDSRVRYGERKGGVRAVRMRHKWGHALVKVKDVNRLEWTRASD